MKVEIKAIAKLARVNISQATKTIRHNPILSEEIHIEESLVNLEESFTSYRVAGESLRYYPKMRRHVLREQRYILNHCIGSVYRMIQGRKNLPFAYTDKDINMALTRLIRMIVNEAVRVKVKIDEEILEIIGPFLSWRQKLIIRYRYNFSNINLLVPIKTLIRKIIPARQHR